MKMFLLMLLLLIVTSCSNVPVQTGEVKVDAPVAVEVLKPEVKVESPVVEAPASVVKVSVSSLTGFTAEQQARFKKIAERVQQVINSKEFQEGVLNFTWQDKKQFVDNEGLSNEAVLKKLLSKDWVIEYRLERLFRSSTIGYTLPNVSWIVINSKHYNYMSDAEVADNIIHEYGCHKLGGFNHAKYWSESRDYSIPYGVGYLGEKIYLKMFPEE